MPTITHNCEHEQDFGRINAVLEELSERPVNGLGKTLTINLTILTILIVLFGIIISGIRADQAALAARVHENEKTIYSLQIDVLENQQTMLRTIERIDTNQNIILKRLNMR